MQSAYILGPMSGIPQFNIPAFEEAAIVLRHWEYDVVSPVELDEAQFPGLRAKLLESPEGSHEDMRAAMGKHPWHTALARDISLLVGGSIEVGMALPGWEKSGGATWEAQTLSRLGLLVYRYHPYPLARRRIHAHYIEKVAAATWIERTREVVPVAV